MAFTILTAGMVLAVSNEGCYVCTNHLLLRRRSLFNPSTSQLQPQNSLHWQHASKRCPTPWAAGGLRCACIALDHRSTCFTPHATAPHT